MAGDVLAVDGIGSAADAFGEIRAEPDMGVAETCGIVSDHSKDRNFCIADDILAGLCIVPLTHLPLLNVIFSPRLIKQCSLVLEKE
jgi:hypothetical protein